MHKLKQALPLLFILLFGFLLRFPSLAGNTPYVESEFQRDISAAKQIINGEILEQGPKASLGNFHFGPAYYYLVTPLLYLFGFNTFALSLTSTAFSVLTIFLVFALVKNSFKEQNLAYLTALLLAINFLDIQFAKYSSNPNLLPFFTVLLFYCLEKIINANYKTFHIPLAGLAFAIACQLHMVPLISFPIILLFLIFYKKIKFTFSQWILFLVPIIFVFLPYLHFELTHNFENIRGLFQINNSTAEYGNFYTHSLEYLRFWLSGIISVHHIFSVVLEANFNWIYYFIANAILIIIIYLFDRKKKTAFKLLFSKNSKVIFSLWILIPSLLLLIAPGNVSQLLIYYFTIFLPLPAILLSLFIFYLYKRNLKLTASSVLVCYILWQIAQIILYNLKFPVI